MLIKKQRRPGKLDSFTVVAEENIMDCSGESLRIKIRQIVGYETIRNHFVGIRQFPWKIREKVLANILAIIKVSWNAKEFSLCWSESVTM